MLQKDFNFSSPDLGCSCNSAGDRDSSTDGPVFFLGRGRHVKKRPPRVSDRRQ